MATATTTTEPAPTRNGDYIDVDGVRTYYEVTGTYGEIRPFHLAASRIWMTAGRKWFHDSAGARVAPEGYGYVPDIWIDSEDASKEAEAIAVCLTREPCDLALRQAIELQKSQAAPPGR